MEIQIFKSSELTGKYGPGHNFFTVDQNGSDILVYPQDHIKRFMEICYMIRIVIPDFREFSGVRMTIRSLVSRVMKSGVIKMLL
jgi:hypothetical protein